MAHLYRRNASLSVISCVVLATMTLCLTGCSSGLERAATKASEAAALLEAGNVGAARQAALASVRARDDIAQNWILLGRIQLAGGQIGDAYTSYSRALELDATNIEAMQLVAEIALQVGRNREAEKAVDQVLALQPNLARPKLVKGMINLQNNKIDDANRLADEILATDPNDDGGIVLKARVLATKNNYADAVTLIEKRLRTTPTEFVLGTLVEVQRAARNGPGLANALDRLIAIAPNNDRVLDLAGVRYKLGQPQAARAVLFKRLAVRDSDEVFLTQSVDFVLAADPGILDVAKVNTTASSGTPALREFAARVLLATGRAADSRRVLEPVFASTTDADIRGLYAASIDALGDRSRAAPIIADILQNDETNAEALKLRSKNRIESGDLVGALADAGLVVRDNPSSVDARLRVIEVALKRRDKRRAQQLFEEALRAMPRDLDMLTRYTRFLTSNGNSQRAVDVAADYTELNPARVKGWDLLQSLCRDEACRVRAATGRATATTLFPADEYTGRKAPSGLFGSL